MKSIFSEIKGAKLILTLPISCLDIGVHYSSAQGSIDIDFLVLFEGMPQPTPTPTSSPTPIPTPTPTDDPNDPCALCAASADAFSVQAQFCPGFCGLKPQRGNPQKKKRKLLPEPSSPNPSPDKQQIPKNKNICTMDRVPKLAPMKAELWRVYDFDHRQLKVGRDCPANYPEQCDTRDVTLVFKISTVNRDGFVGNEFINNGISANNTLDLINNSGDDSRPNLSQNYLFWDMLTDAIYPYPDPNKTAQTTNFLGMQDFPSQIDAAGSIVFVSVNLSDLKEDNPIINLKFTSIDKKNSFSLKLRFTKASDNKNNWSLVECL